MLVVPCENPTTTFRRLHVCTQADHSPVAHCRNRLERMRAREQHRAAASGGDYDHNRAGVVRLQYLRDGRELDLLADGLRLRAGRCRSRHGGRGIEPHRSRWEHDPTTEDWGTVQ